MENDLLAKKLDTLIRLQSHLAVLNMSTQNEKIVFLGRTGLAVREIAEILGTTPNTVNVTLSTARRKGVLKSVKSTIKGVTDEDE